MFIYLKNNMILKIMLPKLVLLFYAISLAAASKLLLLSFVHRHGERMPVVFYPNDPHKDDYWPRALGQLTNKGKQQEFKLGKFIRKRYDGFIGNQYFANKSYYRSTDVDRTLMSAQLVSAGIFNPVGADIWNKDLAWQPIPVHTVKNSADHLLNTNSDCPEYFRLYGEALKVPPLSVISKKYANVFKSLTKHTGMNVNITNFWEIYDDVSKELARNMSEPDWIMDVWDKIVLLDNKQMGLLAPSERMKMLKGGPFIKEVVDNCKNKAKGDLTYDMLMYSAHDTTLSVIMESLDIYNGLQPPYASAIIIEFHLLGASKLHYKDYGIKFLYRNSSSNDLIPLTVPGCGTEMCRFDKFLDIVKDIIPTEIEKECRVEDSSDDNFVFSRLIYIISGFIVLEIIGGLLICCIIRRKHTLDGFEPLVNSINN